MQELQKKFEYETFIQQKDGEIKLSVEQMQGNWKITTQQFANKYTTDLTKIKKEADANIMRERLDKSLYNQQQAIKLRKGEISDVNETASPEIDLSTL